MKKTTEELMNEIMTEGMRDMFIENNLSEFRELSLSEFLREMLGKYNVKKADLFRKAGLVGSNYGYELFQHDRKTPSRDILITLCLSFPLTIEETQYALRCGGLALLYPRDLRDACILYALKNGLMVDALNEILDSKNLKPLAL